MSEQIGVAVDLGVVPPPLLEILTLRRHYLTRNELYSVETCRENNIDVMSGKNQWFGLLVLRHPLNRG
jgi:hypothetical protein